MTGPPRHSVVVPTRNRAALLASAITSALRQTSGDLEVVVSDNASTDATAEVVHGFRDPRVRLVRTPRPLTMPESWAYAIGRARGSFVTILCDDDALHPRALELAEGAFADDRVDVVSWRACAWHGPDWVEHELRGAVRFGPPFARRAFEIDGASLVDHAYAMRIGVSDLLPKMLNAAVRRDFLDRLGAAHVSPFYASCPDYSAAVVLSRFARAMTFLDAPLLVAGATAQSIGASACYCGAAARAYVEELLRAMPDLVMPEFIGPPITWIAQTYLQVARSTSAYAGRTLDRIALYARATDDLAKASASGVDVGEAQALLAATLDGPLARDAPAIRALAGRSASLDSESFIGRSLGAIGDGVDVGNVVPCGEMAIEDVAASIDDLLEREGRSLSSVWANFDRLAAGRRCVVYGAGANGRALLRSLDEAPSALREHLANTDDVEPLESPRGLPFIAPASLDPARHVLLVTPRDAQRIVDQLARRGWAENRDLMRLDDGHAHASRETSAATALQAPRDTRSTPARPRAR